MNKYTLYSKRRGGENWMIERSYTLKSYADQVAKGLKESGRTVKIIKKK